MPPPSWPEPLALRSPWTKGSFEEDGGGAFLRQVFHGAGIEHEGAPIPDGHAVIHGEEKVEQVMSGMVLWHFEM